MELLEGGMNLEALVQRSGRLPPERAVHVLLQICHSLREAHREGVVHRDIKPANICLCRQGDESDFVKVLDFGLVKVRGREDSDEQQLTAVGTVMGTPAYMAPELASGGDASPQSDIYALGCVAYWLLTGQLVFLDQPQPLQQVLAHSQELPEPPSSRAPVPAALDALVLDCLAKDPGRRPESIAVVQERLAAVELANPWTAERADTWWQGLEEGAMEDDPALFPTLQADAVGTAPLPVAPVASTPEA